MTGLVEKAGKSRAAQRLRQLLDRAVDRLSDALPGVPQPRLQPVPVRSKRRKG
jgi:hypothetical protein